MAVAAGSSGGGGGGSTTGPGGVTAILAGAGGLVATATGKLVGSTQPCAALVGSGKLLSALRLHACRSRRPRNATWMARMVKTVMRMWDLPRGSGKVPWGTSGLGVFILIRWRAAASFRDVSLTYSFVSRRGFSHKNPRRP